MDNVGKASSRGKRTLPRKRGSVWFSSIASSLTDFHNLIWHTESHEMIVVKNRSPVRIKVYTVVSNA